MRPTEGPFRRSPLLVVARFKELLSILRPPWLAPIMCRWLAAQFKLDAVVAHHVVNPTVANDGPQIDVQHRHAVHFIPAPSAPQCHNFFRLSGVLAAVGRLFAREPLFKQDLLGLQKDRFVERRY
jgi:hypothetical protein